MVSVSYVSAMQDRFDLEAPSAGADRTESPSVKDDVGRLLWDARSPRTEGIRRAPDSKGLKFKFKYRLPQTVRGPVLGPIDRGVTGEPTETFEEVPRPGGRVEAPYTRVDTSSMFGWSGKIGTGL